MDFPTPKTEPVIYSTLTSGLVALAARYGFHWSPDTVLLELGLVASLLSWLVRRRVAAVHPSTGKTVGSRKVAKGIQVTAPKGTP